MKHILLILLFIPILSFSQNDTSKYAYFRFQIDSATKLISEYDLNLSKIYANILKQDSQLVFRKKAYNSLVLLSNKYGKVECFNNTVSNIFTPKAKLFDTSLAHLEKQILLVSRGKAKRAFLEYLKSEESRLSKDLKKAENEAFDEKVENEKINN